MKTATITEAKNQLSALIDQVQSGETSSSSKEGDRSHALNRLLDMPIRAAD